jgi:hypothetical protein
MFSRWKSNVKSYVISEQSDDYMYYFPNEYTMFPFYDQFVIEKDTSDTEEPSYVQPVPIKP